LMGCFVEMSPTFERGFLGGSFFVAFARFRERSEASSIVSSLRFAEPSVMGSGIGG
jgi:hypothetical protein